MTIEKGICAIPPSAFYQEEDKHLGANLARFAFCKTDEALDEAAKLLKKLRE
jgi:aspartate/methionine/tyrosine aminotransferase